MNLKLVISGIVLVLVANAGAQNLIGLEKEEVKAVIKKEYREFSLDNTIVKQAFNYLKYVNRNGNKTFLIYFSEDDIALSTKMVCDYAEYDFVREELDEKYEKDGKNRWTYSVDGGEYEVTLTEDDWYFVVRTRPGEDRKSKSKK